MQLQMRWSRRDFEAFVAREHDRLELKTGTGQAPIQRTLVAFSNADGGVVLVGVSDDRRVLGHPRDQGTDDAVHAAARDAHDVGSYDIQQIDVEGIPVVAVVVQPRVEGFAQTSDGRVLVRRGGSNVPLLGAELQRFVTARRLARFEASDSGLPLSAVENEAWRRIAEAHSWPDKDLQRLVERGIAHASGNLTVAGALLLTAPSASLGSPKLLVDVRGYETDNTPDYVRREALAGPIDVQIREATRLVTRDLGVDMVVTGSERQEIPRLPPQAVREAIANAVAHRSYEIANASVVIEVRPARLVITSPGPLPESVTVATLRQAQAPRNPVVMDVLRKLGLGEDSGRGIDLIQDSMRDDFLPDPVFEDDGANVRVTMRTGRVITVRERAWLEQYRRDHSLSDDEALLLVQTARQGSLTNGTAREVLAKDSTAVRAMLVGLRDRGLLRREGQRGGSVYRLGSLAPKKPDDEIVLEAVVDAPVTNRVVRELLGIDADKALSVLQRLVEDGRLVREGERRGVRYVKPPTPS